MSWLTNTALQIGAMTLTWGQVVVLLAGPVIVFLASKFVRRLARRTASRIEHIDAGVANAIATTAYYLCLLVGLTVVLWAGGINMTTVAVASGAVAIGVGLGLQEIAKNFVSGMILVFSRPFKPGDRIEFAGEVGDVLAITAYNTRIKLTNESVLVVPNNSLLNGMVSNWSGLHCRWFDVTVTVPFDTDLDAVQQVLLDAAAENPRIVDDPAPRVQILSFSDAGIQISLGVTTTEVTRWVTTRSELNFALVRAFSEKGIGFGVPRRVVRSATSEVPSDSA